MWALSSSSPPSPSLPLSLKNSILRHMCTKSNKFKVKSLRGEGGGVETQPFLSTNTFAYLWHTQTHTHINAHTHIHVQKYIHTNTQIKKTPTLTFKIDPPPPIYTHLISLVILDTSKDLLQLNPISAQHKFFSHHPPFPLFHYWNFLGCYLSPCLSE